MAYDEQLASRVRSFLSGKPGFKEHKMMGGLCFMVRGHMCCGVDGSDLFVRLGEEGQRSALMQAYAKPFAVGQRNPKGFVRIVARGVETEKQLLNWIESALDWLETKPEK